MIHLDQTDLPTSWFNPLPLFEEPLDPPLNPKTEEPMKPEELKEIFPEGSIDLEMSQKREVDVPEEVSEKYKIWRPTPLIRATNLERELGTPARIYFKYEGASPPGSHKPNTALPQTYYAKQEGLKTLTTETGAGQWGSALSFTTSQFGINAKVFMVRVSYDQKPFRKSMIQSWNGDIVPSPSEETEVGRSFLKENPDTDGTLGMAISEAIELATKSEDAKYSLGSVLNHVLIHQSILGKETRLQLEKDGQKPDVLIGCTGGGSNFGGLVLPFLKDIIEEGRDIKLIGAEATACPTLTKGNQEYDYADSGEMTPLMNMYTLGHDFVPDGIHAGGLRYHGMAPIVGRLNSKGYMTARAFEQTDIFEAALTFANTEGYIPAPESAHAIKAAIDEAKKAKEENEEKNIVFNYSGHGNFDMAAYDDYLAGKLEDVYHEGPEQ
ncbi:TrpB-like pyridoxal phosphate-dependent enzyme [Candidatus Bipolaricaulota bacterium]|nr:TrpB-like pyridoxal phosphate-dependent enzyme [Candidatus Bipolaricaulota bacterium]